MVHPLVRAVLLEMSGNDALDADAEANPPERKRGKPRQAWRTEGAAIVREDGAREPVLAEDALENDSRLFVLVGMESAQASRYRLTLCIVP